MIVIVFEGLLPTSPKPSSTKTSSSGILTRDDIVRLRLIRPEDMSQECLKPASYDLRLGGEYMLAEKSDGKGKRGHSAVKSCAGSSLTILPFSSVLVSTYERVQLPLNVVGRFNLRVRMAFKGLVVQMGTQVEPGYRGRLFAIIQNITEEPVVIEYCHYKTRPFTIEFHHTTAEAKLEEADRKEFNHINDLMAGDGFPRAINSITEKVDGIDRWNRRWIRWLPLWLPVASAFALTGATLFVSVLAPIVVDSTGKSIAVATDGAITSIYGNRVSALEGWRDDVDADTRRAHDGLESTSMALSRLEDWRTSIEADRQALRIELDRATATISELRAQLAEIERVVSADKTNQQESQPR
ncbi:MAG: hypothetical protein M9939_15640 [Mesorhizobium sp.]|nr:hypothetical protein [Mesorhizobium sp.]MCO5162565.1 hypothetical protein [Mesorhizobium sp.]